MQPRFPTELQAWKHMVEQMLLQHRVDVQRLQKKTPQVPDPHIGSTVQQATQDPPE